MASTAKRWVAATAVVLGIAALAGGCKDGPPIDDYVHRVFDLQCARIFSCCAVAERAKLGGGATEEACRADRAGYEQLAVNFIRADLDADLLTINEGALATCLTTIEASSCSAYFERRDRNCERAFAPTVEAGGDCSSNLACRSGLCVGFVCVGDTRALGAACASSDDCLSSNCLGGACAASATVAACSGSAAGK
ncbi:MAG: hypothetical protein ABJE95_02560 [Byssovorax sp.]